MTRTRLPDRRMCAAVSFANAGVECVAHVGYYDDGRPGELFIDAGKPGSAMHSAAKGAAVAASHALQRGATLAEIGASCERHEDGSPACVLGAAIEAINRGAE